MNNPPTIPRTASEVIDFALGDWQHSLDKLSPNDDPPAELYFGHGGNDVGFGFIADSRSLSHEHGYPAFRSLAEAVQVEIHWFLCITMAWTTNAETRERVEKGVAIFVGDSGEPRCWFTEIERSDERAPVVTGWDEVLGELNVGGPMADAMRGALAGGRCAEEMVPASENLLLSDEYIEGILGTWRSVLNKLPPGEGTSPSIVLCDGREVPEVCVFDSALELGDQNDWAGIRRVAHGRTVRGMFFIYEQRLDQLGEETTEWGIAIYVGQESGARVWASQVHRSATESPVAEPWVEMPLLGDELPLVQAMRDSLTREPAAQNVKVPRNAPCPCGSGSKAKKCCGGAS